MLHQPDEVAAAYNYSMSRSISHGFQLPNLQATSPKPYGNWLKSLDAGHSHQTLLGVTGSGKTFTMANVIERVQRPALVMAPNKTLAAQLLWRVQGVFFPEQCRRVLRFLLRLLPAGGLRPVHRHVYREGCLDQ